MPSAALPLATDYVEAQSIPAESPRQIALGVGPSAGSIFALKGGSTGKVRKYDLATHAVQYVVTEDFSGGNPEAIAIDPAGSQLLVSYRAKFNGQSAPPLLDTFDVSGPSSATLVAHNDPRLEDSPSGVLFTSLAIAAGRIYDANLTKIAIFDAAITTIADALTGAATAIAPTTATLNGTVDPDGVALSECYFEYGVGSHLLTDPVYTDTVPCAESPAEIGEGEEPVAVHADVAGLQTGTIYDFRLGAANPQRLAKAAGASFTTLKAATTSAASAIGSSSATLNGAVNPEGGAVGECSFQYREAAAFHDERQAIALEGATGGTFTLSFEGEETAAIAFDAEADAVEDALEELAAIDDVFVESPEPGLYEVAFQGPLALTDVPELLADGSGLAPPTATIAVQTTVEASGWDEAAAAPCAESAAEIGEGASSVPVHADVSGLRPNGATYHFRLLVTNGNGDASGADRSFATAAGILTQAASAIAATTATLNGSVDPDGEALSECAFEYGPSREAGEAIQKYPESAPCVPDAAGIGTGEGPVAVHADISGLRSGDVYHYRLKALYPGGAALGQDMSLQALGPRILGAWAEDVTQAEARLRAEIDPRGKPTTYRFEWGDSSAYGNTSPETSTGGPASIFLDELQPGATYHYRVIAGNADGVAMGADRTFTTFEPPAAQAGCPNEALRGGSSAAIPNLAAIDSIAAHCERCSPWCSSTRATALSLTSGGYLRFLDMTSSSQGIWSPSKPGRFKAAFSAGEPFGTLSFAALAQ